MKSKPLISVFSVSNIDKGGSNSVLDHFAQKLNMESYFKNAIRTPLLCGLPQNCIALA